MDCTYLLAPLLAYAYLRDRRCGYASAYGERSGWGAPVLAVSVRLASSLLLRSLAFFGRRELFFPPTGPPNRAPLPGLFFSLDP